MSIYCGIVARSHAVPHVRLHGSVRAGDGIHQSDVSHDSSVLPGGEFSDAQIAKPVVVSLFLQIIGHHLTGLFLCDGWGGIEVFHIDERSDVDIRHALPLRCDEIVDLATTWRY